jgi:hypothetical protein
MGSQPVYDVFFVSLVQLFLNFFQREMHNVMMVHFQGSDGIAETQPQAMQ